MKVTINYEGNSYTSAEEDEKTAAEFMDEVGGRLPSLSYIKLDLEGGGYLLLGKEAVQRCAIVVTD